MKDRSVTVFVCYDGNDWRNVFSIKNPATGGVRTLYPNGRWRRFSNDLNQLITSLDKAEPRDYRWGAWKRVRVPLSVMREVADLSAEFKARRKARKRAGW